MRERERGETERASERGRATERERERFRALMGVHSALEQGATLYNMCIKYFKLPFNSSQETPTLMTLRGV